MNSVLETVKNNWYIDSHGILRVKNYFCFVNDSWKMKKNANLQEEFYKQLLLESFLGESKISLEFLRGKEYNDYSRKGVAVNIAPVFNLAYPSWWDESNLFETTPLLISGWKTRYSHVKSKKVYLNIEGLNGLEEEKLKYLIFEADGENLKKVWNPKMFKTFRAKPSELEINLGIKDPRLAGQVILK